MDKRSKVGEHPYGYTGFEIDITKYLKIGEENVLAVQLTPRDLSSRWYPGAGIYRNVWLRVDNKVYIPEHGVYVTTPTVTKPKAVVTDRNNCEKRNIRQWEI